MSTSRQKIVSGALAAVMGAAGASSASAQPQSAPFSPSQRGQLQEKGGVSKSFKQRYIDRRVNPVINRAGAAAKDMDDGMFPKGPWDPPPKEPGWMQAYVKEGMASDRINPVINPAVNVERAYDRNIRSIRQRQLQQRQFENR